MTAKGASARAPPSPVRANDWIIVHVAAEIATIPTLRARVSGRTSARTPIAAKYANEIHSDGRIIVQPEARVHLPCTHLALSLDRMFGVPHHPLTSHFNC